MRLRSLFVAAGTRRPASDGRQSRGELLGTSGKAHLGAHHPSPDRHARRLETRRGRSLPAARAAPDPDRAVLGRQHHRRTARRRRDLAVHAGAAALGVRHRAAVADLRRRGARPLGRDPAAAPNLRADGGARLHRLQRAVLPGFAPDHGGECRHHPGRHAGLRSARRLPGPWRAGRPGAGAGRGAGLLRRGGDGDPRRAAFGVRQCLQRRRPADAAGLRVLRLLHRRSARSAGDAGRGLFHHDGGGGDADRGALRAGRDPVERLRAAQRQGPAGHALCGDLPVLPGAAVLPARRRSDRAGPRRGVHQSGAGVLGGAGGLAAGPALRGLPRRRHGAGADRDLAAPCSRSRPSRSASWSRPRTPPRTVPRRASTG